MNDPIRATSADLPSAVVAALAAPPPGRDGIVDVDGTPWATVAWGDGDDPPVLLVHGITSSAAIWWRTGPAIAAGGYRVIAIDLPGHGRTGQWKGHHRFRDNAVDLVRFVRSAGLDRPGLAVLGHSWGAMTAAALPAVGLRPRVIVLLDPPAVPVAAMAAMAADPVERRYDDLESTITLIGRTNPTWPYGDVVAKASSLTQFDPEAARAVLLDNGDWDGGLADLDDPASQDVPVWLIRGELRTGGLVPESALPALAARLGEDRILTIAGGPHSPQRTHPEATLVAFLRALA